MSQDDFRIWIKNFKSIGDEPVDITLSKPMNIVIGRNNAGKSSLLEAIQIIYSNGNIDPRHYHRGVKSQYIIETHIGQGVSHLNYRSDRSGGDFDGNHWEVAGKAVAASRVKYALTPNLDRQIVGIVRNKDLSEVKKSDGSLLIDDLGFALWLTDIVSSLDPPPNNYTILKIAAERDMQPENPMNFNVTMPNGVGLTASIANIINLAKNDSDLIERDLLSKVNEILNPDIHISALKMQKHENEVWELFIQEEGKGRIPISSSGSGIKSIIMAVYLFEVAPKERGIDKSKVIYILEELENNLHPSLQRRLLKYVREKSVETAGVFVSTHSSAVIDMFNADPDAQIIHIQSNEGVAKALVANAYLDHKSVLDDLDIRASDILQSNGIIWVEGPSDRIYIRRWIELISDGNLSEGVHYQCLFYGGRLLNHLTAAQSSEDDIAHAVQILKINRNAVVLMDSDRSAPLDPLNATKQRIISEMNGIGAVTWVTDGREIENYLSQNSLSMLNAKFVNPIGQYEEIEKYLEANAGPDYRKKHLRSKSIFAERISSLINKEDILNNLPLLAKLEEVVASIKRWNGL